MIVRQALLLSHCWACVACHTYMISHKLWGLNVQLSVCLLLDPPASDLSPHVPEYAIAWACTKCACAHAIVIAADHIPKSRLAGATPFRACSKVHAAHISWCVVGVLTWLMRLARRREGPAVGSDSRLKLADLLALTCVGPKSPLSAVNKALGLRLPDGVL